MLFSPTSKNKSHSSSKFSLPTDSIYSAVHPGHHIHNCFISLNYSHHLFWEIHCVHIKTGQTQYEVCFLATCLNLILNASFYITGPTLSRQQAKPQQMVTSVNFASVLTLLEDLIIHRLHAFILILYKHVTYLFVIVTAPLGCRLFKRECNKILFTIWTIWYLFPSSESSLLTAAKSPNTASAQNQKH